MSTLSTQGAEIKSVAHHAGRGLIVIFSAFGVDVYRTADWTKLAYARISNVTCGCVNDLGIWIGTSDAGVFSLPWYVNGYANGDLVRRFGAAAQVMLESYNIRGMAGRAEALLVVSSTEIVYLPDLSTGYRAAATEQTGPCAINGSTICYAMGDALHYRPLPQSDWSVTDDPRWLATGIYETFLGDDGALPDPDRWTVSVGAGGAVSIQNDALFLAAENTGEVSYAESIFSIPPNVDFEATAAISGIYPATGVSGPICTLRTMTAGTTVGQCMVGARSQEDTGDMWIGRHWPGGVGEETKVVRSQDYGWVKISRSGQTLSTYYRNAVSDDWALLHQTTHVDHSAEMVLWASAYNPTHSPADYGGYIDDIAVVADSLNNAIVLPTENISALALESDLIIAGTAGLAHCDWNVLTPLTNHIGTIPDCRALCLAGNLLAYGTADGAEGGRFGVLDITDPTAPASIATVAGDCQAVWVAGDLSAAIHDRSLEQYHLVASMSPAAGGREVRRDWTLYAEIVDTLGDIQAGSVELAIDGMPVSPTVTAIPNGCRVEYDPGSNSGYAQRVTVTLSGLDNDGNIVSWTWVFTTAAPPEATVTDSTPPNVVCVRDIGLAAAEADDLIGGTNVIWLDDISSPLIVDDVQAQMVGKIAIDGKTFNQWRLTATFLPLDANGVATRNIRQGEEVSITVPSLGFNEHPCILLAKQRTGARGLIRYRLTLAHYEAV